VNRFAYCWKSLDRSHFFAKQSLYNVEILLHGERDGEKVEKKKRENKNDENFIFTEKAKNDQKTTDYTRSKTACKVLSRSPVLAPH